MGPKNEQMKEDENYIPEIIDTSIMDAPELIKQIVKIKQMIKLEAEANEEALEDLVTTRTLQELDHEHLRILRARRQEMHEKSEMRKYLNESELRDRDEKILNITLENMASIESLWNRYYQQSRIKHMNQQKTELMDLSDITKRMNKVIELHCLHEDSANYNLNKSMVHSGDDFSLGMFNYANKQKFCMLAMRDDYIGYVREARHTPNEKENIERREEFHNLKIECMRQKMETLKNESSFFNKLTKDNYDTLKFLRKKLDEIRPEQKNVKPIVKQVDSKVRFSNEMNSGKKYASLKKETESLQASLATAEDLEKLMLERISNLKKQL